MGDIVVSFDQVKNLKEELQKLNVEYLALYEESVDLKKEKEYLESLYMENLGALIFFRLETEIKYRRLKKKLSLIIMQKNKGEKINHQDIDKALDEELKEFYKNLEEIRANLKKSKEFLELPSLTKEEAERVRQIYRSLAKILHPDVNSGLNKKDLELWYEVKEAYENNDLIMLIVLEGIVKEKDIKDNIKVDSLEETIGVLTKKISDLSAFIKEEKNSFPLNIRELVNDIDYIRNKKADITKEIKEYKDRIYSMESIIEEVLSEESYG